MNDAPLYSRLMDGCNVLPPMDDDRRQDVRPAATNVTMPKGKAGRRKTADRFGVVNGFVDCSMAELSRTEALTWLVLWRDTKNGTARTSASDVARRIGSDRRSVTRALTGLRNRGLLTLIYRGGLNRGTNVYQVHPLATPPKQHETPASRARGTKTDIH